MSSTKICVTVTRQELVPGTGVWEVYNDRSWEGRARSIDRAHGSIRYVFKARRRNHIFTGLYDTEQGDAPLPELYTAAIELKGMVFRCWANGQPLNDNFTSWNLLDEFAIQIEGGRARFFRNDLLVEDAVI